jgi:hypothetical protein
MIVDTPNNATPSSPLSPLLIVDESESPGPQEKVVDEVNPIMSPSSDVEDKSSSTPNIPAQQLFRPVQPAPITLSHRPKL